MTTPGGRPLLTFVETSAPGVEPVTSAEVKQHRRLDDDDNSQDVVIGILIGAARRYAEAYTGQTFIQRTFRATADRFPGCSYPAAPFPAYPAYPGWMSGPSSDLAFHLEHGPVVSVDAINYLDAAGAGQLLDPSKYVVDLSGLRPRVAPASGQRWPDALQQIGAVTIDFTAGYGTTEAQVPASFRNWMLVRIGTLFENREETAVVARGRIEAVPFLDSLLEFDRVPVI